MNTTSFNSNERLATFMLETANELNDLFQSLANERRIIILANLVYERQNLANLQKLTGFQASLIANHLAVLSDSGLIKRIDRGLYDISQDGLDLLQQICFAFLEVKKRETKKLEYLQALIGRYTDNDLSIAVGDKMKNIDEKFSVRIVELQKFEYVSFIAIGNHPEIEAFKKMTDWIKTQGYLDDMAQHPIYGFNNPDPKKGNSEYGYEVWIQVNSCDVKDEEVEIKIFPGGKYAVTTTKLFPLNNDNVIPAWPRLVKWVESSEYECATHQWLEKALTPFAEEKDAYLDLYLPIS
ncbi:MAG: effector binding domain-containing protein [Candidatus Heimdallarchaeota archaeon]|nr:effector binding domain-containing protein [Candidatus Heimdallarchaeota archaeon]